MDSSLMSGEKCRACVVYRGQLKPRDVLWECGPHVARSSHSSREVRTQSFYMKPSNF